MCRQTSMFDYSRTEMSSDHHVQSDSAYNAANHPLKQRACRNIACCSTSPAATATTTIPTAATTAIASGTTIVIAPVLGLHVRTITGAVCCGDWYSDIELMADLVEKFGKSDEAVSQMPTKKKKE